MVPRQVTKTIMEPRQVTKAVVEPRQVTSTVKGKDGKVILWSCLHMAAFDTEAASMQDEQVTTTVHETRHVTHTVQEPRQITETIMVPEQVCSTAQVICELDLQPSSKGREWSTKNQLCYSPLHP